jgi:hypothetical protein
MKGRSVRESIPIHHPQAWEEWGFTGSPGGRTGVIASRITQFRAQRGQ